MGSQTRRMSNVTMSKRVLWASNGGIGDNIFMRPAVKHMIAQGYEVTVRTPWPLLYHDLDVRFEKPHPSMRMERRHVHSLDKDVWALPDQGVERVDIGYNLKNLSAQRTPARLALRAVGAPDWNDRVIDLSLPIHESWIESARKRLASLCLSPGQYSMLYQPTIRVEWPNPARNPRHEYVRQAIECLPGPWISFGAHEAGLEWPEGPVLPAYATFNRGELGIGEIIGLLSLARITVTGHCFVLAMLAATKSPGLAIWGGFHPPEYYFDSQMRHERLIIAPPLAPCACGEFFHECDTRVDIAGALGKTPAILGASRNTGAVFNEKTRGSVRAIDDTKVLIGISSENRAELLARSGTFLEGVTAPDGVLVVESGRSERGRGVAASWNHLLRKAFVEGDYDVLVLLHDDVPWSVERLGETKRLMAAHPDIDLMLSSSESGVQVHRRCNPGNIGFYDEDLDSVDATVDDYLLRMILGGRVYQRFAIIDPLNGRTAWDGSASARDGTHRASFRKKWPQYSGFTSNLSEKPYYHSNRTIRPEHLSERAKEWARPAEAVPSGEDLEQERSASEFRAGKRVTGFNLYTTCHGFGRRGRAMASSLARQEGCPVPLRLVAYYSRPEDAALIVEGIAAGPLPPPLTLVSVNPERVAKRALQISSGEDGRQYSHAVFCDADLWFPPRFWAEYVDALESEELGYWSCRVMNVPYPSSEVYVAQWATLGRDRLDGVTAGRRWDEHRGKGGPFQCVPRGLISDNERARMRGPQSVHALSRLAIERSGNKRSERRVCKLPAYHLDHPICWAGTGGIQY